MLAAFIRPLAIPALLVLLCIAAALGVRWGAVDVSTISWIDFITLQAKDTTAGAILYDVRLPRVLLAIAAGFGLAASGTTWQALLRNPLADPYLIGVSAGGALGAGIAIIFGAYLPFGANAIPLFAFAGSLAAVGLVYALAGQGGAASIERVLLVGVALGAFLTASLSMLTFWHSDSISTLYFWMLGGFSGRGWEDLFQMLPYLGVGLTLIVLQLRHLNVMQLGPERARSLGVDVVQCQRLLLAGASLTTAAVVSASGMIGFVGLVVPHLARLLVGPDLRRALPVACLMGSILLVLSDLVARTVWAPTEVPVGVLTAMLGAPFFLYLIVKERQA
jgi:iron complex transport system permease protein